MPRNIFWFIIFTGIISILYSRILFINPTTQLIGDGGDNYEFMGYLYLAKQNISHLKYPFAHINTYRYPVGFDFSYGYDGAFFITVGTFLSFFLPLIAAYNLTVVIILWLNLLITFFILKKILFLFYPQRQHNEIIAFLGGLLYGWSPYVFARINGHMNLAFVGGLPIFLFSIINIYFAIKNNKLLTFSDFFYIALGLFFTAAGSLQYFVVLTQFILISLIILLVILILKRKIQVLNQLLFFFNKYFLKIIVSFAIFFIPFFFFYGGYLKSILFKKINTGSFSYQPDFTLQIIDIFFPNSYLGNWWLILNPFKSSIENEVTLGIVGWVCIFSYLIFERRKMQKILLFLLIIGQTLMLLYFKPFFVPEQARIFVISSLIIVMFLSLSLHQLPKYGLFLIIIFLFIEKSFYLIKATPPLLKKADEIIRNQLGKAVLQIPLETRNWGYQTILPYLWNKAILNGDFHETAQTEETFAVLNDPDIKKFICDENISILDDDIDPKRIWKKLKALDISTIVLLKDRNEDLWWFKQCANVRQIWERINPQLAIPAKDKAIEHRFEWGRAGPIYSSLFFTQNGIITLERMTIFPAFIDDFSLATPGGIITPAWRKMTGFKKDLIFDFFPRLTFPVLTGDKLVLFSDKKAYDQNIYAALWYIYSPSNEERKFFSPLKLLWKDYSMEIYSLQ